MSWLALALACAPRPTAIDGEFAEKGPAALPERPMVLVVSDIAEGSKVALRASGANPGDTVAIVLGAPGGTTCVGQLNGLCLDLQNPKILARAPADADGGVRLQATLPAQLHAGDPVVFQAAVGPGPSSYLSTAVARTIEAAGTPVQPQALDVLLLLADDIGVDKVGAYGLPNAPKTPTIDSLASNGVLFTRAWSTTWCSPARASLQTGRYGRRTGYGSNVGILQYPNALGLHQTTLPELLALSPWQTYASSLVGKWHLGSYAGPGGALHPELQGFDWWAGSMGNLDNPLTWTLPTPPGYYQWEKVTDGAISDSATYATQSAVDDAITRLGVMTEPWLLEVAFNSAHAPFEAPPAGTYPGPPLAAGAPDAAVEIAMVENMDHEIARLLAALPPDVRARTLVVFAGDNGTPEEAILPPLDPARSKGSLNDGGVRVPFVVSGPMVVQPGRSSDAPVHMVDVFATLAELEGIDTTVLRGVVDPTAPLALDSVSLVPYLEDPAALPQRQQLYSELFEDAGPPPYLGKDKATLRNDQYKLIRDLRNGFDQFYEYVPGALDEGPDLLPAGLTVAQQAGYDDLSASIDALMASLVYDEDEWVPRVDTGSPAESGGTGP